MYRYVLPTQVQLISQLVLDAVIHHTFVIFLLRICKQLKDCRRRKYSVYIITLAFLL